MSSTTIEVYCSYANDVELLKGALRTHLEPLIKEERLISVWDRSDVKPGENKLDEIEKHLKKAHIFLLLVSPDFFDSSKCQECTLETSRAMQRYDHDRSRIYVIPVILRSCDFTSTKLSGFQSLPRGKKPIGDLPQKGARDGAFVEVVKEVKQAAIEIRKTLEQGEAEPARVQTQQGPSVVPPTIPPLDSPPTSAKRRGVLYVCLPVSIVSALSLLCVICLFVSWAWNVVFPLPHTVEEREGSIPRTPTSTSGSVPPRPGDPQPRSTGVTIKVILDSDPRGKKFEKQAVDQFTVETGIQVELIEDVPNSANERLAEYQDIYFKAKDVDVYAIDVTWPGIVANYMEPLGTKLGDSNTYTSTYEDALPAREFAKYYPGLLANNTVNRKLIAIPYFLDVGLLYYRSDLLTQGPPDTWDQLERMAMQIQDEKSTKDEPFWGFVWQGANEESLICNALEWQASHSSTGIISSPNPLSEANPNTEAIAALKRARGWIGRISPREVLNDSEPDTIDKFWLEKKEERPAFGRAAFMRHWPSAYATLLDRGMKVKENFDVAPLPNNGGATPHAGTLGGWQLAVFKDSQKKNEAVRFVMFMTSREQQKKRALDNGYLPTIPDLYKDREILGSKYGRLFEVVSPNAGKPIGYVYRPSTSGLRYLDVSQRYRAGVRTILEGRGAAEVVVPNMAKEIADALRR